MLSDSLQDASNEKMEGETMRKCKPYVIILEQPTSEAIRFRYRCEIRNKGIGSIPGAKSTMNNKTYPTIKIMDHDGPAVVIVSCVTSREPYMPHPYNLIGKCCDQGICTIYTKDVRDRENNIVIFPNINIECITRKYMEESLDMREKLRVDPFRTGFDHKNGKKYCMNFSSVRLCFQVYVEGSQKGKFNVPLVPIVSNPIYDKKIYLNLVIRELCQFSSSVSGGENMILLCDKVAKDDIQIKFFEEQNGVRCWEEYATFDPSDVYKQTAITFKTPKFYKQDLEKPVQVYIELKRPSDGATSDPLPFQMLPLFADDLSALGRKRKKFVEMSDDIFSWHTASKKRNVSHFGEENVEIDINQNLYGNSNIVQDFIESIKSVTENESDAMLPSMISNYNERSAKQHETNIAEMLHGNFTETNDQSYMSDRSQLSQEETNISEMWEGLPLRMLSGIMPKYKEQRKVENNNDKHELSTYNSVNSCKVFDLDKEQIVNVSDIIQYEH